MAKKTTTILFHCSRCNRDLPSSAFRKNRSRARGVQYACRECKAQYRKSHKEEFAQKAKKYYESHKMEFAQKGRRYREIHKEEIAQRNRRYREANKDKTTQRNKEYYKAHKEQNTYACDRYRKTHKKEIAQRNKRYISTLNDFYVKQQIVRNSVLVPADIPQALIETKREYLNLKRQIKESKA